MLFVSFESAQCSSVKVEYWFRYWLNSSIYSICDWMCPVITAKWINVPCSCTSVNRASRKDSCRFCFCSGRNRWEQKVTRIHTKSDMIEITTVSILGHAIDKCLLSIWHLCLALGLNASHLVWTCRNYKRMMIIT